MQLKHDNAVEMLDEIAVFDLGAFFNDQFRYERNRFDLLVKLLGKCAFSQYQIFQSLNSFQEADQMVRLLGGEPVYP